MDRSDEAGEFTPEGYRWASCSREVNDVVAAERHLIRVTNGAITTVCGSTASGPDIWRGNTVKPQCASCLSKIRTRI